MVVNRPMEKNRLHPVLNLLPGHSAMMTDLKEASVLKNLVRKNSPAGRLTMAVSKNVKEKGHIVPTGHNVQNQTTIR